MSFSQCGNYLHGTVIGDNTPVFLHVKSFLTPTVWMLESAHDDRPSATASRDSDRENLFALQSFGVGSSISTVMPVFSHSQGRLQISTLQQHHSVGAVVLQTVRGDGAIMEATVTRLPRSTTLEKSYSTLVKTHYHQHMRLVLNMAAQESYPLTQRPDFILPAILDRQKSTIPISFVSGGKVLEIAAPIKHHIGRVKEDLKGDGDLQVKRLLGNDFPSL
jgi:hypothetical protein